MAANGGWNLRKPVFVKVDSLKPGTNGHTLVVKVINSNTVLPKGAAASPHLRNTRIAECLVADDTASVLFTARNEQGLQSPEIEVIGLTKIYGNVYTTLATRNALHLKGTKLRIADFVHGTDGLGNQNFPPPKGKPIEQSATDFLIQ